MDGQFVARPLCGITCRASVLELVLDIGMLGGGHCEEDSTVG